MGSSGPVASSRSSHGGGGSSAPGVALPARSPSSCGVAASPRPRPTAPLVAGLSPRRLARRRIRGTHGRALAETLRGLPAALGRRESASAHERPATHCLQAPSQQWRSRPAPPEAREARPFPRFRVQPSVARRLRPNLSFRLGSHPPSSGPLAPSTTITSCWTHGLHSGWAWARSCSDVDCTVGGRRCGWPASSAGADDG